MWHCNLIHFASHVSVHPLPLLFSFQSSLHSEPFSFILPFTSQPSSFFSLFYKSLPLSTSYSSLHQSNEHSMSPISFVVSPFSLFVMFYFFLCSNLLPLLPLANPPFSSLSSLHLLLVVSSFCLSTLPTLPYTMLFSLPCLRQSGKNLFLINLMNWGPCCKVHRRTGYFPFHHIYRNELWYAVSLWPSRRSCWRQQKRSSFPPDLLQDGEWHHSSKYNHHLTIYSKWGKTTRNTDAKCNKSFPIMKLI